MITRGAGRGALGPLPLRKQITQREVRRNFFLSAAENLFINAQSPPAQNISGYAPDDNVEKQKIQNFRSGKGVSLT